MPIAGELTVVCEAMHMGLRLQEKSSHFCVVAWPLCKHILVAVGLEIVACSREKNGIPRETKLGS